MSKPAIFESVSDPVYTLTANKAPIDKDTVYRQVGYQQASPSHMALPGFNGTSGSKSVFYFSVTPGLRWGTLALRLQMLFGRFTAPSTMAACPVRTIRYKNQPLNSPPWNMVARFINSINVTFNDQNEAFWKSTTGYYLEDFTARLIRNYDWNVLENRSDMLFTPIADKAYDVTILTADTYNATPATATVNAAQVAVDIETAASTAGSWVSSATTNPSMFKRGQDYCCGTRADGIANTGVTGSGSSHCKPVTKYIPFNDLFPRTTDAIMQNVRKIKIEIEWAPDVNLLEHYSDVEAEKGYVYLTDADIVTDTYIRTALNAQATLGDKVQGQPDILPFLTTQVISWSYNGTDFPINGIRNFDSLMIIQRADGCKNSIASVEPYSRWMYSSPGQFILPGTFLGSMPLSANALTANGVPTGVPSMYMKLQADSPAGIPCTYSSPHLNECPRQVYIRFGNSKCYPDTPLILGRTTTCPAGYDTYLAATAGTSGVTFDPAEAYYEYLKATNHISSRTREGAIPYDVFRTTMPFVLLRPFANDAPTPNNQGIDIQLKLEGGHDTTSTGNPGHPLTIVVFSYRTHVISADGATENIDTI